MREGSHRVAVIIPVIDEEDALPFVLRDLAAVHDGRVFVVDGGSADGTVGVAEQAGATVVVETRRGYGRACMTGAAAAMAAGATILVFLDGDGSDDVARLPDLIAPLAAGEADLVLGVRSSRLRERGAMAPHQALGNAVVAALIRVLHRAPVHDVGPFRAMHAAVYSRLALREMTYGWPVEAVIRAAQRGYRIREVEVAARRRRGGSSKVSGTVSGSLKAGYRMILAVVRA